VLRSRGTDVLPVGRVCRRSDLLCTCCPQLLRSRGSLQLCTRRPKLLCSERVLQRGPELRGASRM